MLTNIAHIDDNEADGFLFKMACEKVNVSSSFFKNIDDFLKNKTKFDAVFTDLNLTHHYQMEVIEQIKKKNIPIYILSGLGNQDIKEIRQVYVEAGAIDFISKDTFYEHNNGINYLKGMKDGI